MTTLLSLVALGVVGQTPKIDAYFQTAFRDASFVAKVVQKNQTELKKINDDFGMSYRFASTNVKLKEPLKMRLDANVEDTTASYVINGAMIAFKVPRLKVNQKQNLADEPGRRQTLMDFGVLTPSLFDDLYDAKFVRVDRATNDAVFDLTYKTRYRDKTRMRIWVNPERKFIEKREWYHRKGRLVATFLYENPTQESGVWLPTRLTVKNADDVVAGVTKYENLKVNSGLEDSIFAL